MAENTSQETHQETSARDLTSGLTLLGREVRQPVRKLETFPNQHPGRRYSVTLVCPEFTCVCPMTGQPDFATMTNQILDDLVEALQPISCQVTGAFNVRGGISITVEAKYEKDQSSSPR